MPKDLELLVSPEIAFHPEAVRTEAIRRTRSPKNSRVIVIRRSIDARQKEVRMRLFTRLFLPNEPDEPTYTERDFKTVSSDLRVAVIGSGPAGLYAALKLIEHGIKPIILERGKDVRSRRRDLAAIHKEHIVDPDSKYGFGEGGAGTYADGKLYTRSTKRGDVQSILQTLVQFGASPDILIDAHPHVGTNKLPAVIAAMRDQILSAGGEIHFETAMANLKIDHGQVTGVITRENKLIPANAVILATGHSARDVFELFAAQQWAIEFKPFALGVRAEHPQSVIDRVQYHCEDRGPWLPPASYSLVEKTEDKSVFSFCMCPGGIIAPCATSPGEIVTNGWSPSKRNNPWANSGIVVPLSWTDIPTHHARGALAGMAFQQSIEQSAWVAGGKTQAAPAQRMTDFVEGRLSQTFPTCSYQPGLTAARLDQLFPAFISDTLRKGFIAFGKKMKGYYTDEAVLVGPESRTSSPVRIPRDPATLEHPDVKGLYPCGEGAGYAGGIVSAAIDGERCATAIIVKMLSS